MKGRIGINKRLTRRWTVTNNKLYETVYQRNTHVWYSNSKFFSGSFQTTDCLHSVSGVECFLFSVACLDNSVGWSLEEFKFRVEFLS